MSNFIIVPMLNHHVEFFREKFPNYYKCIVGNFLYGSQNYELSTSESDIDSILIYVGEKIPNLYHSSIRVKNEEIKLFTVDYFCKKLEKLFLPSLGVFCTKYKNCIIPSCEDMFNTFPVDELCNNAKDLLLYNLKNKLYEHTIEINHLAYFKERKDNLLYNKKRLYWAMRVYDQIDRIQNGENFSTTLVPNNKELLLSIKNGIEVPLQDVVDFIRKAYKKIEDLQDLKSIVPRENILLIDDFQQQLNKEAIKWQQQIQT